MGHPNQEGVKPAPCRILMGTRYFVPIGGVSNQMVLLAEGLTRRGYEVALLTEDFRTPNPYLERLQRANVRIYAPDHKRYHQQRHTMHVLVLWAHRLLLPCWFLWSLIRGSGSLRQRWQSQQATREAFVVQWRRRLQWQYAAMQHKTRQKAYREFQPDMFHYFGRSDDASVYQFFAERHCPIVYAICMTVNALHIEQGWMDYFEASRPFFDVLLAECADAEQQARTLLGYQGATRIIPALHRSPSSGPVRQSGAVRVAYMGRLEATEKGFDLMMDAMHTLLSEDTQLHFEIIGDGPMLPDLQMRFGAHPQVTIHGRLENQAAIVRLSRCAMLVVPSRTEGMSNAVLEAMSVGLPVIAAAVGCLREMITDNGLLIPPNDAAAIAQAITLLATQPATRQRMAAHSLQRAQTHYHQDTILDQYVALYNELAQDVPDA